MPKQRITDTGGNFEINQPNVEGAPTVVKPYSETVPLRADDGSTTNGAQILSTTPNLAKGITNIPKLFYLFTDEHGNQYVWDTFFIITSVARMSSSKASHSERQALQQSISNMPLDNLRPIVRYAYDNNMFNIGAAALLPTSELQKPIIVVRLNPDDELSPIVIIHNIEIAFLAMKISDSGRTIRTVKALFLPDYMSKRLRVPDEIVEQMREAQLIPRPTQGSEEVEDHETSVNAE